MYFRDRVKLPARDSRGRIRHNPDVCRSSWDVSCDVCRESMARPFRSAHQSAQEVDGVPEAMPGVHPAAVLAALRAAAYRDLFIVAILDLVGEQLGEVIAELTAKKGGKR